LSALMGILGSNESYALGKLIIAGSTAPRSRNQS
jgi:hypothetical protein